MIIASIAEAEVNKADYYGKVTRVIENRLEQGLSLGMDSTVAYGNNVKPAQVTTEMTQDESTRTTRTRPPACRLRRQQSRR